MHILVDATASDASIHPIWNYFGYDEPNYTYAKHGQELTSELGSLSRGPVWIRAHNLLTTGDGTPALKWGSTNAYTEDAAGRPVYDWKIVDLILDTQLRAGAKPFVEIGFMPKALSTHPEPYQHNWPNGPLETGWAYPPKDYEKWGELVRQLVVHCVARYGEAEAASWYWEVWNEPNISAYWQGTAGDYDKLYDFTAQAVKQSLPQARVGGPGSTGPASNRSSEFFRQFLEHCARGKNSATGKVGAPLDFITFHAKGSPEWKGDHVRMGLANELLDADRGFAIVASFPEFSKLPIVLSEADPEGCAACSARLHPENAYRNGPLYATYTAIAMKALQQLAVKHNVNLDGALTWAFEFEDKPFFEGYRTLATNGIDKPVLNFFRMAGLMPSEQLNVVSKGAPSLESVLQTGIRQDAAIDAVAAKSDHALTVMIWNYHDEDISAPASSVQLELTHLLNCPSRVLLRHYRIDQNHSNAFAVWKEMGSPQSPTAEQYAHLKAAGQLQLFDSPRWADVKSGVMNVSFDLPRQAISLIEVSW